MVTVAKLASSLIRGLKHKTSVTFSCVSSFVFFSWLPRVSMGVTAFYVYQHIRMTLILMQIAKPRSW